MSASQTMRLHNLLALVGILLGLALASTQVQAQEQKGARPVPAVQQEGQGGKSMQSAPPDEEQLRVMLLSAMVMIGSPVGVTPTDTTTTPTAPATTTPATPVVNNPLQQPSLIVQAPSNPPSYQTETQTPSQGSSPHSASVPEPTSMLSGLIGTGFAGLMAAWKRWRRRKVSPAQA